MRAKRVWDGFVRALDLDPTAKNPHRAPTDGIELPPTARTPIAAAVWWYALAVSGVVTLVLFLVALFGGAQVRRAGVVAGLVFAIAGFRLAVAVLRHDP